MKILMCDENRGFGGSERYLLELAQGLQRRGHQIHLLVRRGSWLESQAPPLPYTATSFSGELDPMACWNLHRLHLEQGFDVVHCHATRDLVVAAAVQRLISVSRRYVLVKSEHCFLGDHRSRLLDWSYGSCRLILPVSLSLRRQMEDRLPGLKLEVVANGIKTPPLSVEPPPPMRTGRWVGYVSSFIPGKGQSEALETVEPLLERHPDLHLLLAGDGPTRAQILARVVMSPFESRIWLPGHVPSPFPYLAGLEVVVLPSQQETFSLVCLEAMAMARPVAAYAVGGIPEVVREDCGALVEVHQTQRLREVVSHYLQDPALARRHGGAGRRRVEESFGFERVMDRMESLYRQLI